MKDRHVLIVGTGRGVKDYRDKILKYIEDNDIVTIGINRMTSLCIPDYHFWTNRQRFRDQHDCINEKSKLLLGCGLSEDFVRKYHKGDYTVIKYDNKIQSHVSYEDGEIRGNFRTAGILSIMIAHINGAKKIDIVGMDGYTLHDKEELLSKKANHHCYGVGYTEDACWTKCVAKDKAVEDGLFGLKEYGVDFRILTPTKFKDFYDSKEFG
jgi:hypothetical protein